MAADVVYLFQEKILFDTSIYIHQMVRSRYTQAIADISRHSEFYLHSIVYEELLVGVRSDKERRELDVLKEDFYRNDRLVTPLHEDWENTGYLLNQLIRHKHCDAQTAIRMTHDVLIALSACRLGIRVVTQNRKDFEKIKSLKNFKLTVWP